MSRLLCARLKAQSEPQIHPFNPPELPRWVFTWLSLHYWIGRFKQRERSLKNKASNYCICIRSNRELQRVAGKQLNNRLTSRMAGICHGANEGQDKSPPILRNEMCASENAQM